MSLELPVLLGRSSWGDMRGTTVLVVVAFLWAPALAAQPAPPHLAETLPPVESALSGALQSAHLADRVIHIGADTNGHITVASIVFTYRATGPGILQDLQGYAWGVIKASFGAVPSLAEIDLTAFHQGGEPFDATRRDATFTAAISAEEFSHIPSGASGQQALGMLPRIWYYPGLLSSLNVARRLERHAGRIPPGVLQPEQAVTFSGPPQDHATESHHQQLGHRSGQVVERKLYRGNPATPVLALTFDDGPVPLYTTLLLDTLDRLGVKATFFLIGLRVQQYPYLAQAIVRHGHEAGNHSFHHLNLVRLSGAEVADELARTQRVITEVTGATPRYFRPPGGDYDATVLHVAQQLGLITVFWTDDPGDYARPSPLLLEGKLLARVSNGGILLLHQGVSQTIQILPQVVQLLQRRGFTITTAGGLLVPLRRPIPPAAPGDRH